MSDEDEVILPENADEGTGGDIKTVDDVLPGTEAKAAKKKFKLMKGTEGTFKYLVVAENGSVGLGVRPLVYPMKDKNGDPGVYIGARIRAASVTGETLSETDVNLSDFAVDDISALFGDMDMLAKSNANPFSKAFGDFDFKKHSSKRASTMVGAVISRAPWQADEIPDIMKEVRLAGKMRDFVMSRLPDKTAIVAPEDLRAWYAAKVQQEIDRMIKAYAKNKAKQDPKTQIEYVDKLAPEPEAPTAEFESGLAITAPALADGGGDEAFGSGLGGGFGGEDNSDD